MGEAQRDGSGVKFGSVEVPNLQALQHTGHKVARHAHVHTYIHANTLSSIRQCAFYNHRLTSAAYRVLHNSQQSSNC